MAADCQHTSRLVRKQNSAGVWMFTYQCQACGEIDRAKTPSGGVWVPRSVVTLDIEEIPIFDDALRKRVMQRAAATIQAALEVEREEWWDRYDEYLASDEWHDKRERVLRRDKYLCQGCLEHEAIHVHHLTYARLFNELLCDLVSLCGFCHQLCHPYKDISGRSWNGRPRPVH